MHSIKRTAAELAVVQVLADAVMSAGSSRFSGDRLNLEIFNYSTNVS